MGLDMYLQAKKSVFGSPYADKENQKMYKKLAKLFPLDTGEEKGLTISFTVGYWRKANQIHKWFVDNVQGGVDNCGEYYVPREELEQLKQLCETKNYLALPPQEGFFFGGTERDEWYYAQLADTLSILERVLDYPGEWSFYYSSSW